MQLNLIPQIVLILCLTDHALESTKSRYFSIYLKSQKICQIFFLMECLYWSFYLSRSLCDFFQMGWVMSNKAKAITKKSMNIKSYAAFLEQLKQRVREAQINTAVSGILVNLL